MHRGQKNVNENDEKSKRNKMNFGTSKIISLNPQQVKKFSSLIIFFYKKKFLSKKY